MRTLARTALAAAGLALAATALPNGPAQAHHCSSVYMFSGYSVPGAATASTLNPGAVGCLNDDEALNTNVIVPGSNVVQVASLATPATAVIDVDGVVTSLKFTQNAAKTRWSSQWVPLPVGTKTVTATVTTNLGFVEKVTYTTTPQAGI